MTTRSARPAAALARALTLALTLGLAGCGGGLYIGFGSDGDHPPAVSLAASADRAAPGEALHLAAAASDDDRVAQVAFYRVDADGRATFLGADGGPGFDWDTVIPADAVPGSVLRFFARATDSAGQQTDSDDVVVGID